MDQVFAGKGKRRVMVGRWKKGRGVIGMRITQKIQKGKMRLKNTTRESQSSVL